MLLVARRAGEGLRIGTDLEIKVVATTRSHVRLWVSSTMLFVSRRVDESLRIGADIEVKVISLTRSRVMLAVTAPKELSIRRIYGKSDYKRGPDPLESRAVEGEPAEPRAGQPEPRKNETE